MKINLIKNFLTPVKIVSYYINIKYLHCKKLVKDEKFHSKFI